jgi:hypothetical protein
MSIRCSNCFAPNSRITVVAKQQQRLCLAPATSQFIALLVQFVVPLPMATLVCSVTTPNLQILCRGQFTFLSFE